MALQPVPYHRPLVNKFGIIDITWAQFFRDIQERLHSLVWLENANMGNFSRPTFSRSSSTRITMTPGFYVVAGTANRSVWWKENLIFVAGDAGTNPDSDPLGADEVHYLYIAYSLITQNAITEDCMYNSLLAPTWSEAKGGWYLNNDRCIFSFNTNWLSDVEEFVHSGDYIMLPQGIVVDDYVVSDTNWRTVDCSAQMPGFARLGTFSGFLALTAHAAGQTIRVRTKDYATGLGCSVLTAWSTDGGDTAHFNMIVNDSQEFEAKATTASTTHEVSFQLIGWHFPAGI
jgi:hypothetical protein